MRQLRHRQGADPAGLRTAAGAGAAAPAGGAVAHNRSLSEDRARSVVAALTAKGITADRLQAAGFGADKPVADNGSEEGKARNRRVELVKR
ncbi:hypothetical protein G6F57_016694 [Rhizopus arrhizus]|nr:hypothetical protein G6F57_016694 [Rhizopus arrhizus]